MISLQELDPLIDHMATLSLYSVSVFESHDSYNQLELLDLMWIPDVGITLFWRPTFPKIGELGVHCSRWHAIAGSSVSAPPPFGTSKRDHNNYQQAVMVSDQPD